MPVTYTITAADVSSVDPSSALTEGVVFNWSDQRIQVPASINSVNPQWVVDHCRFAEQTSIGSARGFIIAASGKVEIGEDPDTGDPVLTGITPVLQENWIIETLKTTGTFQIRDIYNPSYTSANGLPPYVDTAGVDIRYIQTRNATIVSTSSGSSDPATIYSYFTDGSRADAFKADLSNVALESTNQSCLALLQADEQIRSTRYQKLAAGTANVILDKDVSDLGNGEFDITEHTP